MSNTTLTPLPAVGSTALVRWELGTEDDGGFKWELLRADGTSAATVWENGTWHTWDQGGTGGENSAQDTVSNAQMEAMLSVINQGFLSANDQALSRLGRSGWA